MSKRFKVGDSTTTCPYCGADLQGQAVPQEYIDKGYHSQGATYQRTIGVEVPEVYDGILYWVCPDCRGAWPRFTGDHRRAGLSARYAAESYKPAPDDPA